ncbi:MAG: shikimate dehydrogenase [Bacteroidetes bacterium]|nr:shikimate dehydrogenase [Bacteroidota bacterium]
MKTFGLIGKALTHSYSQQYFTEKLIQKNISNAEYQLFSLTNIEEIKALLKLPSLCGFNVTIPYKTEIIPYLDELDTVAQEIGAVNCVFKQNNKWIGYNTDVVGFEKTLQEIQSLRSFGLSGFNNSALVLGFGGAAKAVCYVLKQRNIPFQIVSRNKTTEIITYNEVTEEIMHNSTFIINTTPLGMFPHIDEMPQIPYSALHNNHILIDLIYNPEETLFLKEGKKRDTLTVNGLTMFKAQAEASYLMFKI